MFDGQRNIKSALELVKSTTIKGRAEGLAELKHIFRYNNRDSKIDELDGDVYYVILEALFQCVESERSIYLKATKEPLRASASSRLTSCASTLRVVVEAGVKKIYNKTVRALIEHIIDALPHPEHGHCEPLVDDYAKTLRLILEDQAHVEHLKPENWAETSSFCLEAIKFHAESIDPTKSITSNGFSFNGTPAASLHGGRSFSQVGARVAVSSNPATEFVACVHKLVQAPNSPLEGSSSDILDTMFSYLRNTSTVGRGHHHAFAAVNHVFARVRVNRLQLTTEYLEQTLSLIKDLWSGKRSSIRDDLLTSLILLEEYMDDRLRKSRPPRLEVETERLLEALSQEYLRRHEKDMLHADDLILQAQGRYNHSKKQFLSSHLPLRRSRSEGAWMTVRTIAKLACLLDQINLPTEQAQDSMLDLESSTKRLRTTRNFHDFLRQLSHSAAPGRVRLLQIITMMCDEMRLDEVGLSTTVETLAAHLGDANSQVSSWAMIALAACTRQGESGSPGLSETWNLLWQVVARSLPTVSTSRSASYFLDTLLERSLVSFSRISDSVEAMLRSAELNGPAGLSEASLHFWATLIRLRRQENPSGGAYAAEQSLRWIFSRWNPSQFANKAKLMLEMAVLSPHDLLSVLCACLGLSPPARTVPVVIVMGPLSQALAKVLNEKDLTEYLLMSNASNASRSDAHEPEILPEIEQPVQSWAAHSLLIDLLLGETNNILASWTAMASERPQSITPDMVRSALMFSLVLSRLIVRQELSTLPRMDAIRESNDRLAREISMLLGRAECFQDRVDAALVVVNEVLPHPSGVPSVQPEAFGNFGLLPISLHLTKALLERQTATGNSIQNGSYQSMDIDDDFESQGSHANPATQFAGTVRDDMGASSDIATLRACVIAHVFLIAASFEASTVDDDNEPIPLKFVDYLLSLPNSELYLCRPLVSAISQSQLAFGPAEAVALLEHLAVSFLEEYDFERCESAILFCLEVVGGLAGQWTRPDVDDENIGDQIFNWAMKIILKPGITSPAVQIGFATLCYRLAQLQYPAARTTIFDLFRIGDCLVKFRTSVLIAEVFSRWKLAEHDAAFESLRKEHLPQDLTYSEEIAMRLYVLAELAAKWPTLRRKCVYHVYETAAAMHQEHRGYAALCIGRVASSLQLDDSPSFFRLFAPQLLYTWLDTGQLESAPFDIFGYATLKDLILDVEIEVAAQMVMRRKQDEFSRLAAALGKSPVQMLKDAFARCSAYAIAWDVLHRPKNLATESSEAQVNALVGKHEYLRLVRQHLHEIIGILVCATSEVDQAGKALEKREAYAPQTQKLSGIMSICCSSLVLPAQQQPSFPVKHLFDQLERLCRRASIEPTGLWDPSRTTFCLRMLFNQMAPAYGALHACMCIRKVRLLVALAGDSALEGYSLELLIHGLQPYLTDQYCADDTIGLIQYLYQHGESYLSDNITFVAGSATSIFLSTHNFLRASQDSTTQDSQYHVTKQKTEAFKTWLYSHVMKLAIPLRNSAHQKLFQSLVRNAAESTVEGSAYANTAEGRLLLDLLVDGSSRQPMLDITSRLALFDCIQQNFKAMPSSNKDIIPSDGSTHISSKQLWTLLDRPDFSRRFRAWVARSLGRAFTSAGGSRKFLRNMSTAEHMSRQVSAQLNETPDPINRSSMTSRISIIMIVHDVLRSSSAHDVAAGEEALRIIIERAMKHDETRSCVDLTLPLSLQRALHLAGRATSMTAAPSKSIRQAGDLTKSKHTRSWISELTIALASSFKDDPVLGPMAYFVEAVRSLAEPLFPHILHLALLIEFKGDRAAAKEFSGVCREAFFDEASHAQEQMKILLKGILHLREQPIPFEETYNDRDSWLDIDFIRAARAANKCGMYATALQLAETHIPIEAKSSRRSSAIISGSLPDDLISDIYHNIDDPDMFYGAPQDEGLQSLLERLDFEQNGYKGLLFRVARLDSQIRRTGQFQSDDARGMVHSLMDLNLNSLAHITLSSTQLSGVGSDMAGDSFEAARKLQQWDVKAQASTLDASSINFEAFQAIQNATTETNIRSALDVSYTRAVNTLSNTGTMKSLSKAFTTLASMAEMDEVLSSTSAKTLREACVILSKRHQKLGQARYTDLQPILSSRQTLFSVLSRNTVLQDIVGTGAKDVTALELQTVLSACSTARQLGAGRESLAAAVYLHDLIPRCHELGLRVEARAQFEMARVLWREGEQHASVRMLRQLIANVDFGSQTMAPPLSTVHATLAGQVAEARLENPKEIIDTHLKQAVNELRGKTTGVDAGEVFHEFAQFCDRQLHYSESREEFVRVEKLRKQRQEEVNLVREQAKASKDRTEKWRLSKSLDSMKRWLKLDEEEYQRLRQERETLIELSIENLLRSLHAGDAYDDDVLRFVSLWFEFSDLSLANETASKYIKDVPSHKFTPVMNQLSSRLQVESSKFQNNLLDLLFRVCADHPYHGMYQIFSGASAQGIRDAASKSRQEATVSLSERFKKDAKAARRWQAISQANTMYHTAAMARSKDEFETGEEYNLDNVPVTRDIIRKVPKLKVPPITLHIEARPDRDYTKVVTIHHFRPTMKIAGGLSKPKIIVAIGSDGHSYRQLLKGGSDDLRQDTIMEQVFDQVSGFLKRHPETRQRDLLIRTYKVIPLSAISGVIEFVPNTIPFNDVVIPMHEKYYPNDLRSGNVRKRVDEAKADSNETRIKAFKDCLEKYHPAMRFWFLENFPDPEEWFERRLAYTRSTAASSILGYVMGLGDRHLHNILIDRKSGEVVHIDLGVAFEAGKVLPIPEIIPFRLTRDMVDGMGYSKTEGVFRRCCGFTLDALREERESIMTVLNVLRYDPLCTWTVSPLKARKMQDDIDEEETEGADELAEQASRKKNDDAGEAARALTVVEKKLTKTLSTAATVSELIQQATDERNLALLFAGWSAWV